MSADLNEPPKNPTEINSTEPAGRIAVNTTVYEGERKGQGRLVIARGQLVGDYQVLLDMLH
jgi:hypothetical protein